MKRITFLLLSIKNQMLFIVQYLILVSTQKWTLILVEIKSCQIVTTLASERIRIENSQLKTYNLKLNFVIAGDIFSGVLSKIITLDKYTPLIHFVLILKPWSSRGDN